VLQHSCNTAAGQTTAYSAIRLALSNPFSLMKSQRVESPADRIQPGRYGQPKEKTKKRTDF